MEPRESIINLNQTCTKYNKIFTAAMNNSADAPSLSHGDDVRRWCGKKLKGLEVRGKAPQVCLPASCTRRFPWISWSPRWWLSCGVPAVPWGQPLCRWPAKSTKKSFIKNGKIHSSVETESCSLNEVFMHRTLMSAPDKSSFARMRSSRVTSSATVMRLVWIWKILLLVFSSGRGNSIFRSILPEEVTK